MPNRCFALVPACLGLLSFLISFSATIWCSTFSIDKSFTRPFGSDDFKTGLFMWQRLEYEDIDNGSNGTVTVFKRARCEEYSDLWGDADANWRSAMALTVASWCMALILVVNLFYASCCLCSRNVFRGIGILFFVFPLTLEGLIFLVLRSNMCSNNPLLDEFLGDDVFFDDQCDLGPGAYMIMVSMVGYFLTGCVTCCLGPDDNQRPEEAAAAAVAAVEREKKPETEPEAPVEKGAETKETAAAAVAAVAVVKENEPEAEPEAPAERAPETEQEHVVAGAAVVATPKDESPNEVQSEPEEKGVAAADDELAIEGEDDTAALKDEDAVDGEEVEVLSPGHGETGQADEIVDAPKDKGGEIEVKAGESIA